MASKFIVIMHSLLLLVSIYTKCRKSYSPDKQKLQPIQTLTLNVQVWFVLAIRHLIEISQPSLTMWIKDNWLVRVTLTFEILTLLIRPKHNLNQANICAKNFCNISNQGQVLELKSRIKANLTVCEPELLDYDHDLCATHRLDGAKTYANVFKNAFNQGQVRPGQTENNTQISLKCDLDRWATCFTIPHQIPSYRSEE